MYLDICLIHGVHAFLYVSYKLLPNDGFCLIYSHADTMVYLLYTTSFVTLEEVKNFKSLQSYKHFTVAWVIEHRWKVFDRAVGSILKPIWLFSSVGRTLDLIIEEATLFSHTMQSYSFCIIILVRKHISTSRKYLEGQRGNYFQQIHDQHRCRFSTWNYRDSAQLLVYNYSHYIVKSTSYKCSVTY